MKMRRIDISEIKGFRLGNAENKAKGTGCTVIICEKGAVGGVDVRGGAPATRETDLLKSENTVESVNAVMLSGGSAFGLEAASGAMRALADRGVGFKLDDISVPIVCGASLFDLSVGDPKTFPDAAMGIEAVRNAYRGGFRNGNCGAGTGASVGKLLGVRRAMKTGLGTFACGDERLQLGAVVAVNALGDVYSAGGSILAGLRTDDGTSVYGTSKALKNRLYDESSEDEKKKSERSLNGKAAAAASAKPAVSSARPAASSPKAERQKADPLTSVGSSPRRRQSPENYDIARAMEAEYLKRTRVGIESVRKKLESKERVKAPAYDHTDEAEPSYEVNAEPAYAVNTEAAETVYGRDVTTFRRDAAARLQALEKEEKSGDRYLAASDGYYKNEEPAYNDCFMTSRPSAEAKDETEYSYSVDAADDDEYGYDIPFNTTIGCLITNAVLTKSQANKLASILHDAYARAIKPVHSTIDGDTIFVLSTCTQKVNFDAFAALATDVMQYAVIDGAISAKGAYGLPASGDL